MVPKNSGVSGWFKEKMKVFNKDKDGGLGDNGLGLDEKQVQIKVDGKEPKTPNSGWGAGDGGRKVQKMFRKFFHRDPLNNSTVSVGDKEGGGNGKVFGFDVEVKFGG